MRTLSVALLLVFLIPVAAWADCTGAQPNICISVNQSMFQTGQALQLSATVTPGVMPPTGDVYVALLLPASTLLFLQGDGSFTTNITPLISSWSPTSFAGQVFGYTFAGGEPTGSYSWLAAFAQPGTLNFIGAIASAPFQFTPPIANLSGTYSLTGAITQTGCGPGTNGPFPTIGQVTLAQTGTNLTGTGSFSILFLGASATFQLTGTVSGTTASGSFTEVINSGPTGTGFFNGVLIGTTLVINASGTVAGSACTFNTALTGGRQ